MEGPKEDRLIESLNQQLLELAAIEPNILKLRQRTQRCCCKSCGGKLGLKKINYISYDISRIEVYCTTCAKIEYGIEPELYNIAQYYVTEMGFDYYQELEDSPTKEKMNITKAAEIFNWLCQNLGIIDDDGFTISLEINHHAFGPTMIFSESDLQEGGKV